MAFLPLSALGGLVGGDRGDVARPQVQDRWGRSPTHPNYGQPPGPGESVGNPVPDPTQDIYGNPLGPSDESGVATTPEGSPPVQIGMGRSIAGAPAAPTYGGLSGWKAPGNPIAAMYRAVSGGQYTPTQQDMDQWGANPDPQYLQKIAPAIQQWWNQNKAQHPMGAQPGGDVYGPSAPYGGSAWGQRPQFGGQGGFLPLSAFAGGWGGMFGGRR